MWRWTAFLPAAFSLLQGLLSLPVPAAVLTGKVMKVVDGDTISGLVGRE